MNELLILGAHLIDPAAGIDAPRDILIHGSHIAAVAPPGTFTDLAKSLPKESQINAQSLVVAPGFIDIHVHLREPGQTHKETIATGTAAAALGGFTSVVAMPNTSPVNDSVASLAWMLDSARGSVINLLAMPAATFGSMGQEITDMHALAAAGAVGFTDDGKPILEDAVMRAALVAAATLGVPISQHAEDTRLTGAAAGPMACFMNAGPTAFRLGLRGMPVEAESRIVERDIQLLRDIEGSEGLRPHLHVQHVSTARALAAIRAAKAEGLHVTCEAAPHHFTLTEDAVTALGPSGIDYNTHAKMNPPLRAEADRQAVISAILDGTVDCIATDHAPHASWEKEVEFERAPNGITGLETALGLALRVLHREHGLPLTRVVELLSVHPAQIIHLTQRGTLQPGSHADLVLFNPASAWTYNAASSPSKSHNTPFHGAPMLGRVQTTLCAGRIVYNAEDADPFRRRVETPRHVSRISQHKQYNVTRPYRSQQAVARGNERTRDRTMNDFARFNGRFTRARLAGTLLLASALATGCQSKQDQALDLAKKQAAATGQAQQVVTVDKNGTVTTVTVQPPAPGQTAQTVTTTTTPASGVPANTPAVAGGPAVYPAQPANSAVAAPVAPAQPVAGGSPVIRPADVNIPAGTSLAIRVNEHISVKTTPAGARFTGEIAEPYSDSSGRVILPRGTPVAGVVDESHRRGHFKGASILALRLTTLTLNGTAYPIDTHDVARTKKGKGKRTAAFIGGGTGLGMLIGGVASGGVGLVAGGLAGAGAGTAAAAFTGNRDLDIPAESLLRFKLADDLTLKPS